ncbi:MAG TPA: class E sortase [Nocardioidaceae bacterium]
MSQDTGADAPSTQVENRRTPTPRGGRRAARKRSGRGASFWVGIVLVLGGLSMLGYVAWQFYGTNIVSRQTQQHIVRDLTKDWAAAPRTTIGQRAPAEQQVPVGHASGIIRIPAFGRDYAVPVLEGVGDQELASGFGHFTESADPGQRGNYALAAHRVTHGEPLRGMPNLRPGDKVIVETRNAVYTYVLDTNPNDLVVTFHDIWVVDPLPHNPDGGVQPAQEPGQRLITLTTCSELFHTDNRMIAFGHLVDTQRKPAGAAG